MPGLMRNNAGIAGELEEITNGRFHRFDREV